MHIGVVGEYTAGHITFLETLRTVASARTDLRVTFLPLSFTPEGVLESLPPFRGNWSLRASLRARRQVASTIGDLDRLLVHTQTAGLMCMGIMRRIPTVISTDATPIGYDTVGGAHGHFRDHRLAEDVKRLVVARVFTEAAAVAAWSEWTKASLIEDYGVDPRHIHLIPAGVQVPPSASRTAHSGPVKLMFVARNFEAKGGGDLLTALEGLDGWELDAVTHSRVQPGPRVRVHEGLTPGCSKLSELYSRADAFVLPTRGDSSPFAVLEGMAAGLPIITTAVGALGEIVTDGSGLLVAPGNVRMLREALARILIDPQLRSRMGARARARVIQLYNADINANRLLDLVISIDRTRLRPLLSPAEPRSDAHRHDRETQLL